ncbi:MAG: ATP-binding protein [Myxococcaceae bacterium]
MRGTLLLVLGVMLVSEVVVAGVEYRARVEGQRVQSAEAGLEIARSVSATFEGFVNDVLHHELDLALHLSEPMQTADIERHLAFKNAEYPQVRHFAWVNARGMEVSLGPQAEPLRDATNRSYFREIAAGAEWAVTDLLPSPGPDSASFIIARGLRDDAGVLLGVAVAVVDPRKLTSTFAAQAGSMRTLAVLDRQGRTVYRYPEVDFTWKMRVEAGKRVFVSKALEGKPGTGDFVSNIDGQRKVAAFTPIKSVGWIAVSTQPESEVLAPLRRSLWGSVTVAGVVAIAGFFLALSLSRRITVPLGRLQQEAKALGRGELSTRVRIPAPAELEGLSATFNEMAVKLHERETELRAQTERATAATTEAERQAAYLAALVENLPEGAFIADAEGRVTLANQAARLLLGREVPPGMNVDREAASFGLLRADGTPYPAEELPLSRVLRGETVTRQEVLIERPDGSRVTVMVNAARLDLPGGEKKAIAVFQDVSPLKEAARSKEELVHLISHDLRSPLTGVLASAQILQRRLAASGGEREQRAIAAILAGGRRLNEMIGDLVESTRLQSGHLELRRSLTSLPALASGLVDTLVEPSALQRVRLEVHGTVPPVGVDPQRLERILTNLLTNALKYSASDTEVVLRFERTGPHLLTSVRDRGQGISPEDMPHLFERFYRVAASRRIEGLGLGLYITRMLVEAHGGRIWADSERGRGSTFFFTLPLGDAASVREDKVA